MFETFRHVSTVVADSSGRVSLGKAGVVVSDRYRVTVAEDGSVLLRPLAKSPTPAQEPATRSPRP
jgi:hypothetical protein